MDAKFSANGQRILRYFIDFQHKMLNLHKEVSASELYLLQHKVDALMAQWDARYVEFERKENIYAGKGSAEQETIAAGERLAALDNILKKALKANSRINWEKLKDHSRYRPSSTFSEARPTRLPFPKPVFVEPDISFLDLILFRSKRIREEARSKHSAMVRDWEERELLEESALLTKVAEWERRKARHEARIAAEAAEFAKNQAAENQRIDELAAATAAGSPEAVVEHASLALEASNYDDLFETSASIDYQQPNKLLLVEFELPSPDAMPTLRAVKFIPSTGEMKESHISERDQKANFDRVCYQICLRTLHELFQADEHGNIEQILFNGVTTFVDRSTGRDVTSTIMSILVKRDDFMAIDLTRVDPKACFKSLKGVSASSLAALAPIAPVIKFDKSDRRFIDAQSAVEHVEETTNLASMDWEQFEHLVREVFEREFASRGGEVKITRSSSDGGVDAVAFDPDPFTGGKIVIQAKRYTRTVGVAAVRDLYGTMQHEGASRGILVTTADYGPDAHAFVVGKHILLMTGANLLHLLEKHGTRAKIDIREARKELNLRELGGRS